MTNIGRALKDAFVSCLDIRILFLLLVPLLLTLLVGVVLFATLGTVWVASLSESMQHSTLATQVFGAWSSSDVFGIATSVIAVALVVLLFLPIAYLVTVVIVSIVLMPILLRIVGLKYYPTLQKKYGGSALGNIWNTLKAGGVYSVLLIVTMPLWLIPGGAILVPILLGAYLNKRVFVYDVLEEYASLEERHLIESQQQRSLYGLGAILGSFNYVPLTFVVMPVFAGLAYAHFCLNALKELRDNGSTEEVAS
ncbi:MAG: EI24 domain-containing protein [Bdellovibrionaceae bacterium]|nr:EI24 domain-containing protein [Pseudobdellovibrionaceae bacterium]